MNDSAVGPVVFVLSQLGVGGSEAKTVRLANSLADGGADVTIAYLSEPATLASAVGRGVTLVNLGRRGKLSIPAVRRLAALIRERSARTVVAINLYAALHARLAQFTRAATGVQFIAWVNTTEILPRDRAKMPLYRWALRRADALIFGAESQRALWRKRYRLGLPPQRSAVLYNGVDIHRFAPRPLGGAPRACHAISARLIVGTVARLRPEKAHTDLIRATAALRSRGFDVGALIVGEGEARPAIEAEIARLALEPYVELAGEISDVRPYLERFDLFVLTSVTETFSNAALEAMASGLPIVSSDVGGMPELLAHGGGLDYPAGDVQQLTERLASLLKDRQRRAGLGQEARSAAVEHFSWDRMVEGFLALLDAHALPGRAQGVRAAVRSSIGC